MYICIDICIYKIYVSSHIQIFTYNYIFTYIFVYVFTFLISFSDEGQLSDSPMPLQLGNNEAIEYTILKKQCSSGQAPSPAFDQAQEGTDCSISSKVSTSEGPTSPCRTGLSALARRCQQMREWEDDYTYHSTNHGSQVVVEGSPAFSASQMHGQHKIMHEPSSSRMVTLHGATSQVVGCTSVSSSGLQSSICSGDSATNLDTKPKYFFGDGPVGMVQGAGGGSLAVSAASSMTPSCNIPSSYARASSQSKYASESELSRAKQILSQTESPGSPTKKLNWDRGLLNSLVSASHINVVRLISARLDLSVDVKAWKSKVGLFFVHVYDIKP